MVHTSMEMAIFCCSNGRMPKETEIYKRKIVAVHFKYLSAPIKKKASGIKGFLGKKQIIYEERDLIINDKTGIALFYSQNGDYVKICFSNEEEWERIKDYEKSTLLKMRSGSQFYPYQIEFLTYNLKTIIWEKICDYTTLGLN